MFGLGTTELVLILIIVVVLFGASKLPEVGAGIAKGIRNFRKHLKDDETTSASGNGGAAPGGEGGQKA